MKAIIAALAGLLCMIAWDGKVLGQTAITGQTEISGWGNLRGIRFGGQLVTFTTAIGVYSPDFKQLTLSQREGPTHTSQYTRDGNTVTVGESLQIRSARHEGIATSAPATQTANNLPNANDTRVNPGDGIHYTITY